MAPVAPISAARSVKTHPLPRLLQAPSPSAGNQRALANSGHRAYLGQQLVFGLIERRRIGESRGGWAVPVLGVVIRFVLIPQAGGGDHRSGCARAAQQFQKRIPGSSKS